MPKEPSLPAVHLAGVERAQVVVAAQEAADRNGREIAAEKAPDAIPPVRGIDTVRGATARKDARRPTPTSRVLPESRRGISTTSFSTFATGGATIR